MKTYQHTVDFTINKKAEYRETFKSEETAPVKEITADLASHYEASSKDITINSYTIMDGDDCIYPK